MKSSHFVTSPLGRRSLRVRLLSNGFRLELGGGNFYLVRYPHSVWKKFPPVLRRFVIDNFVYARVRPLSLVSNVPVDYTIGRPFFQQFIDWGIQRDISKISALNVVSPSTLYAHLRAPRISFAGEGIRQGELTSVFPATDPHKAVLALSLGKDSLLSWGVAQELGIDCMPVMAKEMDAPARNVWRFKKHLLRAFSREQKKIFLFEDDDELFSQEEAGRLEEADNTNSMFTYALQFLPFIMAHGARYLLVGNERNMNDYFLTPWGQRAYPSLDQSAGYTVVENRSWKKISGDRFSVVSLIEPLYNIAEMRILYRRYPHLLKYMMSCALEYAMLPSLSAASLERWCYACPGCAKAFLYSAAAGGDPRAIAFRQNFFESRYAPLYPLFNPRIHRHYERPPAVREEQLLAFLLAERYSWKGDLITRFKHSFYREACAREKELRKRYLGVHPGRTIPAHLSVKIMRIYQEALKGM